MTPRKPSQTKPDTAVYLLKNNNIMAIYSYSFFYFIDYILITNPNQLYVVSVPLARGRLSLVEYTPMSPCQFVPSKV